jgi:hypothetical protein
MIENLIVALIVALAFVVACAKLLPARWRQHAVFLLARGGATQSKMARWFGTEASCGGGCDSCKACAEPVLPVPPTTQRVIKLRQRR